MEYEEKLKGAEARAAAQLAALDGQYQVRGRSARARVHVIACGGLEQALRRGHVCEGARAGSAATTEALR